MVALQLPGGRPYSQSMTITEHDWEYQAEERTSGIYRKSTAATTPDVALDELHAITGDEPVAVLFFASAGRPPEAAAYPPRPRRFDGGYSLTHRLSSWAHGFSRGSVASVPAYLTPWFPCGSVIVVPISTPDWDAGVLIVSRKCAVFATEIRSLACDLALRLELADRRTRIQALRLPRAVL